MEVRIEAEIAGTPAATLEYKRACNWAIMLDREKLVDMLMVAAFINKT